MAKMERRRTQGARKPRSGPAVHYIAVLLLMAEVVVISLWHGGWLMAFIALPLFYLAYDSYHVQRRHAEQLDSLHLRTIEALAVAIDAKDNTTSRHIQRVAIYAEAIGVEMGLCKDDLKALRAAALLHDIGKLAVPEYIISKPGRLTEEEFDKMKIHTVVGAEILERVQFPYPVVPIVRSHHERWNGTGYPDGLQGEQIPIGARILAVVDSFDALASDRHYRRALPPADALAAVKQEAGKAYDPSVVAILERLYPRMEAILQAWRPAQNNLSTNVRIEKGEGPTAGLSIEKVSDTSSALYSIVQARQELQILYELTEALGKSLSVEETLQFLAEQLKKLIRYDGIAIYLIRDGKLAPRFVEGENSSALYQLQIPIGKGLSGWVAGNGKCSLNGNPQVEPEDLKDASHFSKFSCALSVPLDSAKGIIGALTLYSARPNAFTVNDLRILKAIGVKAGFTIHNALIHEAIGKSARTDELTGLPNARALRSRLEEESARALRQQTPYLLLIADLNGLKQINDTWGHQMGDKVIQGTARALRGCLRDYDFLARIGGDEFILLLPGMKKEDEASKRVQLAMAVDAAAKDFPNMGISISMGVAAFPVDGQDIERLLAIADRRMYQHKPNRRRVRQEWASAALPEGEASSVVPISTAATSR